MSEEWDMKEFRDEIIDTVEDAVRSSVEDAVSDLVKDALFEAMANCDLETKDGTIIRQKQMMRLISPEQDKVLLCFGGLLVTRDHDINVPGRRLREVVYEILSKLDTSDPTSEDLQDLWSLRVQTWVSTWDTIATYPSLNEAINAMKRVNQAILDGCTYYQL